MTVKQRKRLARIIIAFIVFIAVAVMEKMNVYGLFDSGLAGFIFFLVPYALAGYDIIFRAARSIAHGQVFNENFLMTIATFGAFATSEYAEAVAVMLFYQVGELFQNYAVNKSRQSIKDLMDICPEYANREEDGRIERLDPEDIAIGDTIVIKAGEKVPLDGVVLYGDSQVDTSALTGESVPRRVMEGSEIISGCLNVSGLLKVRVTKDYEDSTVSKILELVEIAGSRKARVENFITKFARYYTPAVVAGAVLLAVLPPIFLGGGWLDWMIRACTFLVISCPCALVISVPLSFFGGIGAASRRGILVKGSNYIESLAELKTVVFDKTGTLTRGEFKVTQLRPEDMEKKDLLEYTAYAESCSNHPIAKSILEYYGEDILASRISEAEEIPGCGVIAAVDGKAVLAGNDKLMKERNIAYTPADAIGTVVYTAVDDKYAGFTVIADTVREESQKTIADLKKIGISKISMLTGDKREVAEKIAECLGIDEVFSELLPGDKVTKVEELLDMQQEKSRLAFVGDGINDAPVLIRADIGIAMGGMGSDAAIEAADVVLMDDNLSKIPEAIRISQKTLGIVRQNIVFALAVKGIILLLGALGLANMWAAVFADVGVAVLAILNAMRTLKTDKTYQNSKGDLKECVD